LPSDRILSVDLFRLLAILAVITIHTQPFAQDLAEVHISYWYIQTIINQLTRFAVPFFFIISGYFWGIKIKNGAAIVPTTILMAQKIGLIFLAWCLIYLLPYNITTFSEYGLLGPIKVAYWNLKQLAQHPENIILEGTKIHLWFLVSLLFSLIMCSLFLHFTLTKSMIIAAAALYIFGILGKSYADTPLGISLDFNTRNGPFFSFIFFITGFFISKLKRSNSWFKYGCMIYILGCCLHFLEVYALWKLYETPMEHDYVFGTYFMGLGVSIIALSNHPILKSTRLSKIGKMTLGIYAIHIIFVDLLKPLDRNIDHPLWEVSLIFLILLFSIFSTHLLAKNKITRKLVI